MSKRHRGVYPSLLRRSMFGIRALLRLHILLLDWNALSGRRPPRHPIACRQIQIDLHSATLGASSRILRKVSCRSPRTQDLKLRHNFSSDEGVLKLPQFADKNVLLDLSRQLESSPSYNDWVASESSPRFSFGMLNSDVLRRLVRKPGHLLSLVEHALGGDPWLVAVQAWALRDSGTPDERSEAALGFHCDADFINFVKLFVPLRAISENECTQFVIGSQRGPKHALYRADDDSFRNRPIWRTSLELGDSYLMCTDGWHSASASATPRIMLQALFSTDLFGVGAETARPLSHALSSDAT